MTDGVPVRPKREDLKPDEVLCDHCTAKCCHYFAMPIDTPEDRRDYDFIRWFLLHDRATVFTEDEDWYLLVHTSCKHLQPDHRCGIYETRPRICREYSTDNCEYDEDATYDRYFETAEQVHEYAEAVLPPRKRKGIRSSRPSLLPVIG
jgi:Fe-S-cluster containining protein